MSGDSWWHCNDCGCYWRFHSITDEAIWSMCRNNCTRCHSNNIIPVTREEIDKISAYEYVYWDLCYMCGERSLVSSGTGCCKKCDNPNTPPKVCPHCGEYYRSACSCEQMIKL